MVTLKVSLHRRISTSHIYTLFMHYVFHLGHIVYTHWEEMTKLILKDLEYTE